jgi:8-oxo-dGTP pyrophosphatase MutT (NUDIX family)
MLKRADGEGWCIPGGGMQFGEDLRQCALREFEEECGCPRSSVSLMKGEFRTHNPDGLVFTTFQATCPEEFTPKLNDEHEDFIWVHPYRHPKPLHPGFKEYLEANGFLG